MRDIVEYVSTDTACRHAFPAIARIEAEIEGNPIQPIDRPDDDDSADTVPDHDDPSHRFKEDALAADAELLEEMPLPGVPVTEQERRRKWLSIPRAARIAIRRLHQEFGHVSRSVLVELLKASKAPPECKGSSTLCLHGL